MSAPISAGIAWCRATMDPSLRWGDGEKEGDLRCVTVAHLSRYVVKHEDNGSARVQYGLRGTG